MAWFNNKKKDPDIIIDSRTLVFAVFIGLLFLALACRLFVVQIVKTSEYSTLASTNQIRVVSTEARRGNIYDRDMELLANSQVVFSVGANVSTMDSEERDIFSQNLAGILNDPDLDAETIRNMLRTHARKYETLEITTLNYDDDIALLSKLEENRDRLPGLELTEKPQRNYPGGTLAGHLLGYTSKIGESEQGLIEGYNYLATDTVGKSGLESTMERFTDNDGNEIGLRGKRGLKTVEVDSNNNIVRTISEEAATPGNSLVLTIDADVQRAMENALAEVIADISQSRPKCKAGAGILINVKTGGVIAMASYPTINPNDFTQGMNQERADYYFQNESSPLLNRTISTAYPPGSTFKASTAIAVLSSNMVDGSEQVACVSSAWVPPMAKCTKQHGSLNLYEAMAVSCNTYFQTMAKRVGIDTLYDVFKKLGYGQLTGIELTGEVKGLLASPEWKDLNFDGYDSNWMVYDTYYMSMGQGYSNYTVVQMANSVATIANNGKRMQTHLVDKIINENGDQLYKMEPTVVAEIEADDSAFAKVRQAMRAVTSEGGTAYSLFLNFPVAVGAKTGTAQTGLVGDDKNEDYHGWFVAFAPYDDPEVAFAGVVEYGYHGNASAGKVCKETLAAYFGVDNAADVGVISGNLYTE